MRTHPPPVSVLQHNWFTMSNKFLSQETSLYEFDEKEIDPSLRQKKPSLRSTKIVLQGIENPTENKKNTTVINSVMEYVGVHFHKKQGTWHHVYRCKNKGCPSYNKLVSNGNTGLSNYVSHLKSEKCLGPGGFDNVFESVRKKVVSGETLDNPAFGFHKVNPGGRFMTNQLKLFIERSKPISACDDPLEKNMFDPEQKKLWISSTTMRKHLGQLNEIVEERIVSILPDMFSLLFDGWTCGRTHYLGVFAAFVDEEVAGEAQKMNYRLLSISPLMEQIDPTTDIGDEMVADSERDEIWVEACQLTAEKHVQHLCQVLSQYYGIDDLQTRVACIVGDNTNLNPRIAEILGLPFVGCASHRHNLEITRLCREQPVIVRVLKTVGRLMKTCRTLKNAAELKKEFHLDGLRPLTAILFNLTRWRGKYEMLARYSEILPQLLRCPSIPPAYFPNGNNTTEPARGPIAILRQRVGGNNDAQADRDYDNFDSNFEVATNEEIEHVKQLLQVQDTLCGLLQRDANSLEQTRSMLDLAADEIEEFCQTSQYLNVYKTKYLRTDSAIVRNSDFEQAICHMQQSETDKTNLPERYKIAMSHLRVTVAEETDTVVVEGNQTTRAAESPASKKKREEREIKEGILQKLARRGGDLGRSVSIVPGQSPSKIYRGIHSVPGTTAAIERCFSVAKNILRDTRRSMTPYMFETYMFLRYNSDLWGIDEVNLARQQTTRSKREREDAELFSVEMQPNKKPAASTQS